MRTQLLLMCVVVSGCTFDIRTCKTDDDCVSGGRCGEGGFCVAAGGEVGGGSGGGSATGGGIGTGGGTNMTGGGTTTGGGTGGGSGLVCDGGCAAWEECLEIGGAPACSDMGLDLSWNTPDGGVRFGPNQVVPLKLTVSRADGGVLPVAIPFSLIGTTTSLLAGPSYAGSVQLNNASGTKTLWAGWDGGPSATTTFDIDNSPPNLNVVVDRGYHRRDELIYGILQSDDFISDSGISLGDVPMQTVATSFCPNFNQSPQNVACYEIDLSKPEFRALDGGFGLVLSATDSYGNSTSQDGGVALVTRVRWVVSPTDKQIQAMAVGSDGALYVGSSGAGSGNTIFELAADGSVIGDAGALGEVQSLAISRNGTQDVVYVAYNSVAPNLYGNIGARNAADLQISPRGPCSGANNSKTYSGIALYWPSGASAAYAVGSINSYNGNNGLGCVYRTDSSYDAFVNNTTTLDSAIVPSTGVTTANNVVILGDVASFIHQDTTVTVGGSFWQPVQLSGTATPGTAVRVSADVAGIGAGASPGQAATATNFIVTTAYDVVTNAQVYSFVDGGSGNLTVNAARGVAAIESDTRGYFGQGSDFVFFDPSALNSSAGIITHFSTSDVVRTSPVLGDNEGYAVSNKGTVIVFASDAGTPYEKWHAVLGGGSETVLTHMAFDANRANCASGTGILYIGTQSGAVYSVIVDSSRLYEGDGGAWPKYQRTMGNAGNTDSVHFPINWNGCP